MPRPPHHNAYNAAAFQLRDVVGAYHLRTPYPPDLGAFLAGLTLPPGGPVIDLGCGTSEIARMLAPLVARVDAVDISERMITRARTMPGGDDPAIQWHHSALEEFRFAGQYSLAVAGDSIHWMDWPVIIPRLAEAVAPDAFLAIVTAVVTTTPWSEDLRAIISRHSVIRDYAPYDLIDDLGASGIFERKGEANVGSTDFTRTVDEYIDALHATAGMPRERMPERGTAFDQDVRELLRVHITGRIRLQASARVTWGRPLRFMAA